MREREIFHQALDLSDANARNAFLDDACAGDATLKARIVALLTAHAADSQFLKVPAWDQAQPLSDASAQTSAFASGSESAASADDEHDAAPDLSFLVASSQPSSLGALGHYEILSVLGQGAFGIVLKAFDERLHRLVAIKVMNPQLAATSPPRKRFLREARSAAAIKHENVVQVYAVEEQPLPYLVMEYVEGQTLQDKLNGSGPLDLAELLHLGRQMANGLAAAHAQGLVHRDIKPGNILIEAGAEQRLKITDFGLARAADDASLTRTGMIFGTPTYMAPEQALGLALDHRADLFSMGSVLYQMASGRVPFRGANPVAVLKRVIDETPRDIQEIIPEVPTWLCAIIGRLHAKKPADRFDSAREVAEIFKTAQAELQQHGTVSLPPAVTLPRAEERPQRRIARMRPQLAVIAAAVILMLTAFGFSEATGVTSVRSTVVRLFTSSGTLVLEVDDPDVSVAIDGETLVVTGAGVKEIRLSPGPHQVQARKEGKLLREELVTITKNGRQAVRVYTEPAIVATFAAPPETPAAQVPAGTLTQQQRQALEWVLQVGGKLEVSSAGQNLQLQQGSALPAGLLSVDTLKLPNVQGMDDAAVENLRHAPRVSHALDLYGTRIGDAGLAMLASWPQFAGIQRLTINFTPTTDEGMAHVAKFKQLTSLGLEGTGVTHEGLAHLVDLPLKDLYLRGCGKIDDAAVPFLNKISTLEDPHLHGTAITDGGLKQLALPHVMGMALFGNRISDAGVEGLLNLPALRHLALESTRVSDDGLSQLRLQPSLETLFLHDCPAVTDAGLECLKEYPSLTKLGLIDEPNVSDVGLASIADCQLLRSLVLLRLKVSAAAVQQLADARRDLHIVFDGKVIKAE